MRERAIMLGGQFTIHSAPGSGTRIGVEVPLVLVMAGNSEPVASRRT
jgi:signal transduction histidine kinase